MSMQTSGIKAFGPCHDNRLSFLYLPNGKIVHVVAKAEDGPRAPKRVDRVFAECIDGTLSELLGTSGAEALKFHAGRSILSDNPTVFLKRMEKLLGEGAKPLEARAIAKFCRFYGLVGIHPRDRFLSESLDDLLSEVPENLGGTPLVQERRR